MLILLIEDLLHSIIDFSCCFQNSNPFWLCNLKYQTKTAMKQMNEWMEKIFEWKYRKSKLVDQNWEKSTIIRNGNGSSLINETTKDWMMFETSGTKVWPKQKTCFVRYLLFFYSQTSVTKLVWAMSATSGGHFDYRLKSI